MARSPSLAAAELELAPRGSRLNPLRLLSALVGLGLWIAFVALASRTSHYLVFLSRYSREYAVLLALVAAAATLVTLLQLPRVWAAFYGNRFALLWLGVVCPLLALGAIEGSMRLLNLLGSEFYSEIRRYMSVLQPDAQLYFKNPVAYRGVYQRVEIATNELGLRDRPLEESPPARERLLVLGDSVAFGWGVKVEDTFPRQLERHPALRAIPLRTVNSAVPGYNTHQEWMFLKTYAQRVHPNAVLLLYVDNDIDPIDPLRVHMGVRPGLWRDPRGVLDYYLSMSRLYFMVRHMAPFLLGPAVPVAQKRATPGWRDSFESLAEIARYCRNAGMPLAAFHFRMMPDPTSNALESDLAALAQTERFLYRDTLPWFQGRNIRRLTNSFIDTHPNAEGHRILAEGISRVLLDAGILPGAPPLSAVK